MFLGLGPLSTLLLIADGARWIRSFFTETLATLRKKTMLLDWHHLKQKCYDLSSRICRGKLAKGQFPRRLYRRLWRGDVPGARCAGGAPLRDQEPGKAGRVEGISAGAAGLDPELSIATHRVQIHWERAC
jgi:hypothetical protein